MPFFRVQFRLYYFNIFTTHKIIFTQLFSVSYSAFYLILKCVVVDDDDDDDDGDGGCGAV